MVISDPCELAKLLDDRKIEISCIDMLDEESILVCYDPKEEFIVEHNCSNPVISAWTTSIARLTLHKTLKAIAEYPQCQLLYSDTGKGSFLYH